MVLAEIVADRVDADAETEVDMGHTQVGEVEEQSLVEVLVVDGEGDEPKTH